MLNLYVNAWQSMPGGGELHIETENVVLDDDFVRPYEVDSGKYVKVSVTDTGVGMDKATQERIFDPFFTTKEMGRGTGLGLASAYGIVKNHGGIFKVASEKGEGSVFSIFLPASKKEVIKHKELSSEIMKGDETILLVDDEDIIIDVGTELLTQMGYKVLAAKSGKASIKIYEANQDKIDMVILDMIMPEMDGGETYDEMRKINPDIKVLLSSGYSIEGQATEILERGCSGFIQKPFNIRKVAKKIREILSNE
jgi:CheY-like chemotaxis protein